MDSREAQMYYSLSKNQRKIFSSVVPNNRGLITETQARILREVCSLPFDQLPLKLGKPEEFKSVMDSIEPLSTMKIGMPAKEYFKRICEARLKIGR